MNLHDYFAEERGRQSALAKAIGAHAPGGSGVVPGRQPVNASPCVHSPVEVLQQRGGGGMHGFGSHELTPGRQSPLVQSACIVTEPSISESVPSTNRRVMSI